MKRTTGIVLAAMTLLLALVIPTPEVQAQATLELPEFVVAEATSVVNAVVTASEVHDFEGSLYTIQELEIGTTLTGELSGKVRVAIPGGMAADGSVHRVSIAPVPAATGASLQVALSPAPSYLAPLVVDATGDDSPVYYLTNGDGSMAELNPFGSAIDQASVKYDFNGAARPSFRPPQSFVINPSGSGLGRSETIATVIEAFKRWERDGLSDIDFSYGGTTTAVGFNNFGNLRTEVSWEFPNVTNQMSSTTLAVAGFRDRGDFFEFDIVLNRNQNFSVGAASNRYDLETVVAHEVGHGIGLGHTSVLHGGASAELMYLSISRNTEKPIGAGDLEGARALYPSSGVGEVVEPGHSVASNASGDVVVAAVKQDGRLYVRRDLGSGFGAWAKMGANGWVSADVAISPAGSVYVIGVKDDGKLYTRRQAPSGAWGGWVLHGSNFSTQAMPSIAVNGSRVVWAAITELDYRDPVPGSSAPIDSLPPQKIGGELITREFQGGSWTGFTRHAGDDWVRVDIDIADDGDIWFVGIFYDQFLAIRSKIGGSWSSIDLQGAPTWESATEPAIAASNNAVIYGATKNDGRLFTRFRAGSTWFPYDQHGKGGWAGVDVAMTPSGGAWLAAEKSYGRLYTRQANAAGWLAWTRHGADTWSAPADPSIAVGTNGRPMIMAVKEDGRMYLRKRFAGTWRDWARQGGVGWAVGR